MLASGGTEIVTFQRVVSPLVPVALLLVMVSMSVNALVDRVHGVACVQSVEAEEYMLILEPGRLLAFTFAERV